MSALGAWPSVPLEDLLVSKRDLTYGIVQPGGEADGGIPIVRVRDVRNGSVNTMAPLRVDPDIEKGYERSRLRGGELLVTLVGTVGETAVAGPELAGWNVARAVAVARVKPDVGARWVTWAMKLSASTGLIAERLNTTVQATLNLADLRQVPIPLPPEPERAAIAATLGALDDKIESNAKSVNIAEALGDALFAECVSGTQVLTDVALLTMGSSPPGSSYTDEASGLPFYQGVRDFGRRFPGLRIWTTQPVRVAEPNDTLVSVRAPVGKLNRASRQSCIGRGVASVRSAAPSTIFYALRAARHVWEPFQHEGTVFGAINRDDLGSARIPWPSELRAPELEDSLATLDARVASLVEESIKLVNLRDALLPEFLSGRVVAHLGDH